MKVLKCLRRRRWPTNREPDELATCWTYHRHASDRQRKQPRLTTAVQLQGGRGWLIRAVARIEEAVDKFPSSPNSFPFSSLPFLLFPLHPHLSLSLSLSLSLALSSHLPSRLSFPSPSLLSLSPCPNPVWKICEAATSLETSGGRTTASSCLIIATALYAHC